VTEINPAIGGTKPSYDLKVVPRGRILAAPQLITGSSPVVDGIGCKYSLPYFYDACLKFKHMKSLILLTIASFIFIKSIGQSPKDTESIKKIIIAFQEDFNDGRFNKASDYATLDWVHIAPNGGIGKGRDTLAKVLRNIHQTFLKGVSMSIESMTVRFLTYDVAVVEAIHIVSNYTTPDGVKHENERQIKTYIVVNQKGKWLLTLDQNTIIQNSQ
jgi:uncharacterized protein (TIGR02246 family)